MVPSGLRPLWGPRFSQSVKLPRSAQRLRHRAWTATPCRWSSSESSSEARKEKPYYVTTPIFYVNAAPHIGHLYTMIVSDVVKRWQQLKGVDAFLSTGTDEHGLKIQQAALREEIEPEELCDSNSAKFNNLAEAGDISYTKFIRTTDRDHKEAVALFYKQMKTKLRKGLGLYKASHEGWYSVSDECFYAEDETEPGILPQTGKKVRVSIETGSEVEWISEETWFFPLTNYKDALLQFYDENPGWIQPEQKMREVRNWVENHLEDLSVTRPSHRLSWGIRDPTDSRYTIYVWVDALINYLTVSGYGRKWKTNEDNMGIWPADLQVVGKDIIRFHAVYWPAMLMALGLPLPKKILCHNHWTMSNRKMSKSVGNVVNPFFAIQRWGVDPLRYFLMRNGSLQKDTSYSNDIIEMIYVKDLQANIGNLLYRVTRPKFEKRWNIKEAVQRYVDGVYEKETRLNNPNEPGRFFTLLESTIDETTRKYKDAMDNLEVSKALDEVFNLMRDANRYISEIQPWVLVKAGRDEEIMANWAVFNVAEALRVAAILLTPVIPSKSEMILDELNVNPERRTLEWAIRGADKDYGRERSHPLSTSRMQPWDSVFPPVPTASVSDMEVLDIVAEQSEHPPRNKLTKMAEYMAMEARIGPDAMAELLESRKKPQTPKAGSTRNGGRM